jgi:dihydroneopterin aldolase
MANDQPGGKLITMDIVYIEQLEIETIIGINDWERKVRQKVCIDLEMAFDIRKAGITDNIEDTLNYKLVAKRIIQFVESSQFMLIEALAENIASIVREEFQVP